MSGVVYRDICRRIRLAMLRVKAQHLRELRRELRRVSNAKALNDIFLNGGEV
jgi:hypothetical protein